MAHVRSMRDSSGRCRGGQCATTSRRSRSNLRARIAGIPNRERVRLFASILIGGKHLLIVPSGPLTQLPFQVLVTAAPTSADHRAVAWLARAHAITVLPAVSSLKALRRVGRPSTALRPMLG